MAYYHARQRSNGLWIYIVEFGGECWIVCESGCKGHRTPEAAWLHYRKGLIADAILDGVFRKSAVFPCVKCNKLTRFFAEVGFFRKYPLCDQHRTRSVLEELFPKVGWA